LLNKIKSCILTGVKIFDPVSFSMKKIYIIILVALLVRLFHISFTVIGWHSWRQSDTAAITRNFYENGYNILYPQIDWRGNTPGYVESEFHIYPFIVSLLYGMFGASEFWGRLVSVMFSLFTILGIYLLVKKYLGEKVAFWSSFIYAILPLNIFYGRAFMPELLMLMCSVYGIFYFTELLDKGGWKYFILTFLFVALAILIKLPALYIGFLMVFLIFQKHGKLVFVQWRLFILGILILLPAVVWYYHAHNLYMQTNLTFAIWDFSGDKWTNLKTLLNIDFYHGVFLRNIAERHLTYPGFILFVWGLFIKRTNKREKIFDFWLISVLIYFIVVALGVNAHEYYQLPFTLPASVFIGKAINKIIESYKEIKLLLLWKIVFATSLLLIALIPILSILRVTNFYKSENEDNPIFKCANEIKLNTNKNDLIITVCDGNPVFLYIFDRKGWLLNPVNMKTDIIQKYKQNGAKCVAANLSVFDTPEKQKNLEDLKIGYKNYKSDNDYIVFYLDK
jgi:4-amino-4-deoxy-L-arabinose transferase-like glycosyltransferase